MKTTIRTLTMTAAAFGVFAAAGLASLGPGTAHADDDDSPVTIQGVTDIAVAIPSVKPALTVVPTQPTATPTPKIRIIKPLVTATPTPKVQIAIPPTKTPTPKPEIVAPPTATPTTELPIAPAPTDEPTEEPSEETTEEPTATSTPEPAPQQPQGGNGGATNGGNGGEQPADGNDGSEEPVDEPADAETSDQYSLEDDRRTGRERGSGLESVPGVGLMVPVAKEVIGADELTMVGGALAAFGVSLGLVAYKRERRREPEAATE